MSLGVPFINISDVVWENPSRGETCLFVLQQQINSKEQLLAEEVPAMGQAHMLLWPMLR